MKKCFKLGILLVLILTVVFGGVIVHRNVAAACSPVREKIYTSVKVAEGDSLWSLAEEYCEYSDNAHISLYMDELKTINNIVNADSLKTGYYVTVYYYQQ